MSRKGGAVYLLDVNVLIALFDPGHIHHDTAHDWFAAVGSRAWATCPLTENGFVRILSNPAYPGRRTTVADAVERLGLLARSEQHVFWADDVSVLDPSLIDAAELAGHRDITDAYLLALAVAHGGALATFDASVRIPPAMGAKPHHLAVLGRR